MNSGIEVDGNVLVVRPPKYPSKEVKETLGGRWDKKISAWRVQPTALNVLTLGEWYGEEFINSAPAPVQDLFYEEWGFKGWDDDPRHAEFKERAVTHPHWDKLFPFQQKAVEYCVCNPHRGCISGLSPGLGKTVVAVIVLDVLQLFQVLILAPVTLAKNWGAEINAWSMYNREWKRATADDKLPCGEITITNYETVFYTVCRDEDCQVFTPDDHDWVRNSRKVREWINAGPTKKDDQQKEIPVRERLTYARPAYSGVDWDAIVIDESILIKNRKSVRVKVTLELTKFSHWVFLLSGSATSKFADDLFPQVRSIMPRGFSAYWRFTEFFCVVDKGGYGWTIEGDRPDHAPQKYLKDFYFVRNQKDVLPELPDYIYNPIEIDLLPQQARAFDQMVEDWIVQLADEEADPDVRADTRLAQQTRMLQITSNLCNLEKGAGKPMPSVSAKEDLLVDLIRKGDIEFPLLVWTWYNPTTRSIDARLDKEFEKDGLRTLFVNGTLTTEQKDLGIEMYKEGEADVLILQMSVGKFGHTLVNTRTAYYHDRTYESDAYLQSLRRVKRIGLTHSPRLIIPRARISADPIVELNLAGKMQSIARVASHDLQELLKSLGQTDWAMTDYNTGQDV